MAHDQSNGSKLQMTVNPPFIYGLDSMMLHCTDDVKQGVVTMALGNGSVALYAPKIGSKGADSAKGDDQKEDDQDVVDDPVCCHQMHQSAVSDVSFGHGNDWLVSAGTDKNLMISNWALDEKDNVLTMDCKFKIPMAEKPNSM